MTAAMFKIRGGKPTYTKPDGSVGTAGKGPLLSDEFAFTLATMHDQTLIAPPPPQRHDDRLLPQQL